MKRTLLRFSALAAIVAVGLSTFFAVQRPLPQAKAQEPDPALGPAKRPSAKSSPGKNTAKLRAAAKKKGKHEPTPAKPRPDPFAPSATSDRYADRVEPPPFDAAAAEAIDDADGNSRGESRMHSSGPQHAPARPSSKKNAARSRVPTPALDRRALGEATLTDDDASGREASPADEPRSADDAADLGDRYARPFEADEPEASPAPTHAGRRMPRREKPIEEPAPYTAAEEQGTGRPGNRQLEGTQTPSLSLEKTAPEEIQVGKPATFTVRVRNTGTLPAQHVEIRDEVPQGTRLAGTRPQASRGRDGQVIWSVGTIKAGEEVRVEMEVVPLTEGEVGSVATVHFAGEASVRTRCTRPQLTIEAQAPREVLLGEKVTLSIRISNPGTGVATGVVLAEDIPEELSHPAGTELEYEIGQLAPNESREVELTMTASQAGSVVNVLRAKGDGQLLAETQAAFDVVAPRLKVALQGPKRRYLERQATYTVSISNPGTAAARDVELVTHLPKGLKFVNANNSGEYDPQTNSVHWLLDELPPKGIGEVKLTALPIEAGEQTMRVEGLAQRGLKDEQEEVISVEGVAAILFQVVDLADPIEVGGETTYEVRVVNQGSKTATNVQLLVSLPRELKPTGADGPTRHEIAGQDVQFQPLAKLAPKAETTYRINAEGLSPGDLRVQVQLLTDEMLKPVTKEESTRVYADE